MLQAAPGLQLAMRTAGTLYLLWLAWRVGRSGPPHACAGLARPVGLVTGVWMLWHNPKGWAMTVSAAASFAALASGPGRLALLLGLVFGVCAAISLSSWCMAGQVLARRLRTDRQWHILNTSLAALLVASIVPMWL